MDMEAYEAVLERLTPQILSGELRHSWAFVTTDSHPDQQHLAGFDFEDGLHIINDRIMILNPFGGDTVRLLSKRVLEEERTLVGVQAMVIFDSNMANLLIGVTKDPGTVDATNRADSVCLLETLLAWNCTFSPLPYFIERSSKDPLNIAGRYAWRSMMAYLSLVTIDEEYVRATSLVRPDKDRDWILSRSASAIEILNASRQHVSLTSISRTARALTLSPSTMSHF